MIGEARFTYTDADMRAAQRAAWMGIATWRRYAITFAGFLTFGFLVAGGAASIRRPSAALDAIQPALFVAALITIASVIGHLFLALLAGRGALKNNLLLGGERHWWWDQENLHIKSEFGTASIPWQSLQSWSASSGALLFYQSRRIFFPLPRRAMPASDVDKLVGILRDFGPAERRRFGLFATRTLAERSS